jgi:hypothetical protein
MHGRGLLVIVAALVAAASLTASPAGAASPLNRYGKHGISFRYPGTWKPMKPGTLAAQRGSSLWTEWLGPPPPAQATVLSDLVMLSAYHTPTAITRKNARLYAGQIAALVAGVAKRAGGKVLSGPKIMRMGGLPGYGFRIRALASKRTRVESRLVLVWKGKTELFLNCQHAVGGSRKAAIEKGCATIVGSFKAR